MCIILIPFKIISQLNIFMISLNTNTLEFLTNPVWECNDVIFNALHVVDITTNGIYFLTLLYFYINMVHDYQINAKNDGSK